MVAEVLVIGCGVTGAALSHYCSRAAAGSRVRLTFWDKARGPGGRFSTVRSRTPGLAIVDHGAQYITRGAGAAAPDSSLYDELLGDGIIQPYLGAVAGARAVHETQEHFVCRDGMSSVAQHLLAGSAVEYERRARELDEVGGRWRVKDTEGRSSDFDAVVLTLPTPQLLELEGGALRARLAPHLEPLRRVSRRYSMRFAACAWFDAAAWEPLLAVPWCSKYFRTGEAGVEALVYLSIEPRKRLVGDGDGSVSSPAVLLHSSVPFGISRQDAEPDDVLRVLLSDMHKAVPGLPPPTRTKLHRWRYSQVPPPDKELDGDTGVVPGAEDGALLLPGAGGAGALVVAGDGLVGSNFDNCCASARAACSKLLGSLGPE